MPLHDAAKDLRHGCVVKLGYTDGVEMTKEAWSDGVPPTSRGSHGAHDLDINQVNGRRIFQVVPTETKYEFSIIYKYSLSLKGEGFTVANVYHLTEKISNQQHEQQLVPVPVVQPLS